MGSYSIFWFSFLRKLREVTHHWCHLGIATSLLSLEFLRMIAEKQSY